MYFYLISGKAMALVKNMAERAIRYVVREGVSDTLVKEKLSF